MKSTHKIIGIIILTIVSFNFAISQQQNQEEEELIVGTWVEETATIANRWVFTQQGVLQRYSDNQIYETYTWQITSGQTPSGLTISHLILTNVQDSNDIYRYEIDGIDEEVLVLIYQRPNWGPAPRATYLRQ